jgi:nitrate reductase alpha subunit
VLGVEKDVVLTPILHDTPMEIAQALDVKDWKKGEVEPIPGKTMPQSPWSSATIPTSTSASPRSAR